jgi:hypothetical protein
MKPPILCHNKSLSVLAALSHIGLRPFALTCAGKSDGGGAQVHAMMSVQAFSSCFGIPYIHTPFSVIDHTSSKIEVDEWENSFALGVGFSSIESHARPIINVKTYAKSPANWIRRDAIVCLRHAHGYLDDHVWPYDSILERVRTRFLNGKGNASTAALDVAVHVRRGDVIPSDRQRYTHDRSILTTIECIARACANAGVKDNITIYSQGKESDFTNFAGYELRLNINPLDTLRALATASLFVMAKSSFSYVAALLNAGIVVYEPFWHTPRDRWVYANDETAIERRVSQYASRLQTSRQLQLCDAGL